MKKYKIYAHKLYSAKDIERRTRIGEKKIIDLLEKRINSYKPLGRKMGNFWFIRGREVSEITKLLKDKRSG